MWFKGFFKGLGTRLACAMYHVQNGAGLEPSNWIAIIPCFALWMLCCSYILAPYCTEDLHYTKYVQEI